MTGAPIIAVAQLSCESNSFTDFTCDLDTVRKTGYLLVGDALFDLKGSGTEVAGMLEGLVTHGPADAHPLVAARWTSSAVVTTEAYRRLKELLLERLRDMPVVDGVLISCHGSMVAEGVDDTEGDLALAIRGIVGDDIPIAMTLDLHGNVTDQMFDCLTFIVGYETYPHVDSFETGARAAHLLMRAIRGEVRPVSARVRLPMIQSAYHASTVGDGPFARVMRQAKSIEGQAAALTASVFMVGSYIDVPEMGCSVLVTADGDTALAHTTAQHLAHEYWAGREEFLVATMTVAEAVEHGRRCGPGPVVLLDTADTTGGGAAGDSIDLVTQLLDLRVQESCLATVVDPVAAQACHRAGEGSTVTIPIGHRMDPRWGTAATLTGVVEALVDGRFEYSGGIFRGTPGSMGLSAVLRIGSTTLLIQSLPSYEFADEQYRAAGLRPESFRFIGVKNMMNFRQGYGSLMSGHFVLDLPGPTPADMRSLPFTRVRGPWYPRNRDLDPHLETVAIRVT
jgi:microcystin degradation protein MlrC